MTKTNLVSEAMKPETVDEWSKRMSRENERFPKPSTPGSELVANFEKINSASTKEWIKREWDAAITNKPAVNPLESVIRWHPVSEQVPPQFEKNPLLVAWKTNHPGVEIGFVIYMAEAQHWFSIESPYRELQVTHWAEMPEYPHPQQPTPVATQS